jgi:hypothetical protein
MRPLLALALLVALAAPAKAAYPGERPADGLLWDEVSVALEFWADRGVTGCPGGIHAVIADDLTHPDDPPESESEADGATLMPSFTGGRGGGCALVVSSEITRQTRRDLSEPDWRRDSLEEECGIVVHDVRHALPGGTEGGVDGMGHTATGIMGADFDWWTDTPWDCKVWARKIDRRIRRDVRHRAQDSRHRRARRDRGAGSRSRRP